MEMFYRIYRTSGNVRVFHELVCENEAPIEKTEKLRIAAPKVTDFYPAKLPV